jgi:ribosomal 50S subunit-recycling heat shock protein
MAGSPYIYCRYIIRFNKRRSISTLTGTIDIQSGSASVQGIGTRFTSELKIGDSISFTNDSGNTETKIIEAVINDTSLTLSTVTAAASTKHKLQEEKQKFNHLKKIFHYLNYLMGLLKL